MNSIRIIHPYKDSKTWSGTWVFDDEEKQLHKEPFVSGADTIIEFFVTELNIKNAYDGFDLIFSDNYFPGYHIKASKLYEDHGGNWYRVEYNDATMDGWLCPALFKYFDNAPNEIFIQFKEARRK